MKYLLTAFLAALLLSFSAMPQASDSALKDVVVKDRASRDAMGRLMTLTASEHLSRGQVYYDNRQFPQAIEHFQKIFDNYPADPVMSSALFLTGRSYYWQREYARAIPYLDRVSREYPGSKDGREGMYFKATCNVRIGRNMEAAQIFAQYTVMYPTGEHIDGAYLNTIDALREAGKDQQAIAWVDKTREHFKDGPTSTNALQARLRLELNRGRWADAEATAALIQAQGTFPGSMTSVDEIKYLRAHALEKPGKPPEAMAMYAAIPATATSYYGGLAADKASGGHVKTIAQVTPSDFPAAFRSDVLQESKKRNLDPRFVLAIMKQESTFRPGAKSPSAARGLLQLVFDTAIKYSKKAGYANLQPDDLYQPHINIAIGCEYIAALRDQFAGLNEAIAASYNGGEDNAARWLNRSKGRNASVNERASVDPGIFAAEVGFAETKQYVFKVMAGYRVYRQLYDENLNKR